MRDDMKYSGGKAPRFHSIHRFSKPIGLKTAWSVSKLVLRRSKFLYEPTFQQVKALNLPGSGENMAKDKGVCREDFPPGDQKSHAVSTKYNAKDVFFT